MFREGGSDAGLVDDGAETLGNKDLERKVEVLLGLAINITGDLLADSKWNVGVHFWLGLDAKKIRFEYKQILCLQKRCSVE